MSMGAQLTALQWADINGVKYDTLYTNLHHKKRGSMEFGKSTILTPETLAAFEAWKSGAKTTDKKTAVLKSRTIALDPVLSFDLQIVDNVQTKTTDKDSGQRQSSEDKAAKTKTINKDNIKDKDRTKTDIIILYCLAVAPTIASVRNIWIVCMSVMGEWIGATALTVVLCSTGIALTYIGVRSRFAVVLVVAVMAFETLANVTTIFAGLFDINGLPLKFLGTVTSIFNSGTHITAIILAVFAAVLLVGAQLAAIFELQKRG